MMNQGPRNVRRIVSFVTACAFICVAGLTPATEAATVKVPAGTAVVLTASAAISPQSVHPGDVVMFTVVNDVAVDGRVVIKAGAKAKGEVEKAQKRGIVGKPDAVTVRINSVTAADGKELSLSAVKSVEGDDKVVLTVVLALICLPLILLKGGEAQIAAGTNVPAQTVGSAEVIASIDGTHDDEIAVNLATWPSMP